MVGRRSRFWIAGAIAAAVAALLGVCLPFSSGDPSSHSRDESTRLGRFNTSFASECQHQPIRRLCENAYVLGENYVDSQLETESIDPVPKTVSVPAPDTAQAVVDNFLSKSGTVDRFLSTLDFTFNRWQRLDAAPHERHFVTEDCDEAGAFTCEILWRVRPGPHVEGVPASEQDVYTDAVLTVRLKPGAIDVRAFGKVGTSTAFGDPLRPTHNAENRVRA